MDMSRVAPVAPSGRLSVALGTLEPLFRRLDARGHYLGAQLEAWARPDDLWEHGQGDVPMVVAVPADARGEAGTLASAP